MSPPLLSHPTELGPRSFVGLLVFVSFGALTVCLAPACGPSRCGAQCPADPEPPTAERKRCEQNVAPVAACTNAYSAYRECADGRTVCGRDDRTDVGATTQVVIKECGPQLKAYTDCTSVAR